ncbi:hypothetical protein [Caballeronia sp. 15715]|uniref:hypothetical protein n=1 Tax=unclassified Caballeronia TaxID=2646786 RepID=UPI0039E6C5F4
MFQLFSNHSSASDNDQAASPVHDNGSAEEAALPAERPATYEEMLPWLLLGAVPGF